MALTSATHTVRDYSQCGEGKMIVDILRRLPDLHRTCVEFGAADGMYYSNTRHLIDSYAYRGWLIEADDENYEALRARKPENAVTLQREIGWSDRDSLDSIESIPDDPDVVSIDIDGNDYHVWEAMERIRPAVVCIEYNPTIPNEVIYIQAADKSIHRGCSIRALVELGNRKGYSLVAVTVYNAIFVRCDLTHYLILGNNSIEALRKDHPLITYLFSGYDGHLFLGGAREIPWHKVPIRESDVQAIPSWLQSYQHHGWKRLAMELWRAWRTR